MKKKYCFCILCMVLFVFSGCARTNQAEGEDDVEFYTEDNKESDYEIDAYTGKVTSYDHDAEHHVTQEASSGENAITEEAAKKLALDRVPGASEGDIRKFKMEQEDGRVEYEGKIIYDGMEYEFEIDADSGAFIDWEQEPVEH